VRRGEDDEREHEQDAAHTDLSETAEHGTSLIAFPGDLRVLGKPGRRVGQRVESRGERAFSRRT
jgi:hypothetical protein